MQNNEKPGQLEIPTEQLQKLTRAIFILAREGAIELGIDGVQPVDRKMINDNFMNRTMMPIDKEEIPEIADRLLLLPCINSGRIGIGIYTRVEVEQKEIPEISQKTYNEIANTVVGLKQKMKEAPSLKNEKLIQIIPTRESLAYIMSKFTDSEYRDMCKYAAEMVIELQNKNPGYPKKPNGFKITYEELALECSNLAEDLQINIKEEVELFTI